MEDIPCSRVGHIYRKYVPYKVPGGVSLARVSLFHSSLASKQALSLSDEDVFYSEASVQFVGRVWQCV